MSDQSGRPLRRIRQKWKGRAFPVSFNVHHVFKLSSADNLAVHFIIQLNFLLADHTSISSLVAPLRVRQCVCARVGVSVLYKCVLTSRNNHVNQTHTPQRSKICKCKEYAIKVASIHFIWKRLNTCLCCKWSTRTPEGICQTCKRYVYIFPHDAQTSTTLIVYKWLLKLFNFQLCIYSKTHTSSILSICHSCYGKV